MAKGKAEDISEFLPQHWGRCWSKTHWSAWVIAECCCEVLMHLSEKWANRFKHTHANISRDKCVYIARLAPLCTLTKWQLKHCFSPPLGLVNGQVMMCRRSDSGLGCQWPSVCWCSLSACWSVVLHPLPSSLMLRAELHSQVWSECRSAVEARQLLVSTSYLQRSEDHWLKSSYFTPESSSKQTGKKNMIFNSCNWHPFKETCHQEIPFGCLEWFSSAQSRSTTSLNVGNHYPWNTPDTSEVWFHSFAYWLLWSTHTCCVQSDKLHHWRTTRVIDRGVWALPTPLRNLSLLCCKTSNLLTPDISPLIHLLS